ncbi:MAG TPA: hypothetical protein VF663_08475 [Telluria sp.]
MLFGSAGKSRAIPGLRQQPLLTAYNLGRSLRIGSTLAEKRQDGYGKEPPKQAPWE